MNINLLTAAASAAEPLKAYRVADGIIYAATDAAQAVRLANAGHVGPPAFSLNDAEQLTGDALSLTLVAGLPVPDLLAGCSEPGPLVAEGEAR